MTFSDCHESFYSVWLFAHGSYKIPTQGRTRMKRTVRLSSSVGGRYVPMSVLIVSMYIITPRYLHRVSLCLFTVALWGRQLTEQAGDAGQGLGGNGKVGEEDQLFDRMPPCVKIS